MVDCDCTDRVLPFSYGVAEEPAEAVVTVVAEKLGQSPLEMAPLMDVVDPDALNELFHGNDRRSSAVSVTFDYCGVEVTVTGDGIRAARSDGAEK